jgi:hypothetical protein
VKATSSAKNDSEARPIDSQADSVLREWRDSAFYWKKHLDMIRVMFAPLTQALIGDAGIIEGDSVLDVAGGSGRTVADHRGNGRTNRIGDLHRCRR